MMSFVAQFRSFLSRLVGEDDAETKTSLKRDSYRSDNDFTSDEGSPSVKRPKTLRKLSFSDYCNPKDMWEPEEKPAKNIRYVPIQTKVGYPQTSTPNEGSSKMNTRTIPINLVETTLNGPSTSERMPHMRLPLKPEATAVIDDDDESDQEVILVETKPRKPTKIYKAISVNENDEDDVIFVKEEVSPQYVCLKKSRIDSGVGDGVKYYKICRKLNERQRSSPVPREYNKFKTPVGITKSYKKPNPLPNWMQNQKAPYITSTSTKPKHSPINGNARTTLSQVFNLDEKKNYRELIKKVADSMKPAPTAKRLDITALAEESAAFRLTQRSQKNALKEINLVEKQLGKEKDIQASNEYDPVTVASINSSDSEIEIIPSGSSTSSVRIDRINSLRDSLKDKAVTSEDWLSKLQSKYKKKNKDLQEKLIDARRESDIISKVNYEQKLSQLEHKLKYELSIPESLIEEPQPTVELPPLTPEQEKLVKTALGPGPPGQLLVEKFNLRIHRRDLQTLAGLNWLNDEVINFYMNLLMQRCEENKDVPKVYATNTFFYPKLIQSGQAGLRRWTRKIDVFAHDLMVVPVHLGVHWCLSLIDFRKKKISYLDSMGSRNQQCLDALLQYLKDEHKDKKGQPFDEKGWTTENLNDIPQQMNGSDCGMFACTFAEFSSRGAPYTFTQAHMPYLRRKAALEILQGRLLL